MLCSAMVVSLLSGCGSKADSEVSAPASSTPASSAPASSEPASSEPEKADGEEITIDEAGTVSDQTADKMVISEKVGKGTVTLKNVTVTDTLYVYGGTVINLEDCTINNIVVLHKGAEVRLVATKKTNVEKVTANSPVVLEEKELEKDFYGFKDLVVEDECPSYALVKVQLVNTKLDQVELNKETDLTKTGTSAVENTVHPENLVDNSSNHGKKPSSGGATVPAVKPQTPPAPQPPVTPSTPDTPVDPPKPEPPKPEPPKPEPPKPELTEAEKLAQQSFNTLPVFVDKNGKEITSGALNIPETSDTDYPYLSQRADRTKNQEGLEKYGYVEKEYFLKGTANIYGLNDTKDGISIVSQGNPYTNRVIVFMPEDPADFKGVVYVDILNASSKVDVPDLWRRGYEHYMKNGYAYVGVTSKTFNVDALHRFNPERYKTISWDLPNGQPETGFAWDIFGQVGALLKENGGASRLLYGKDSPAKVQRAYLIGQSQSGFYLNTFNNGFNQSNYIAGTDKPIYDGMINVVGAMANTGLSTDQKSPDGLKACPVPYVTLVGENDYMGQAQRANSNTATDKYRYYVVTGGAHSNKVFPPDPLDEIQIQAGRDAGFLLGFKNDAKTNLPHTAGDLDMDVYFNAILELTDKWVRTGEAPAEVDLPDKNKRDEYGNMLGGLRSPQIDAPVASYSGGANGGFSTDGSSMVYLQKDQIAKRYPDGKAQYLREYEKALDQNIQAGWILAEDRDRVLAHAQDQAKVIFDNETYDKAFIEETMKAPLKVQRAGNDVTVTGPANVYGVLKDNQIYVKKGNLPKGQLTHTTKATIQVPDTYNGHVVIDLQNPAQPQTAAVVDADAAHITLMLNQQWELPHLKDAYRTTDGFVWDAISQIANSVKTDAAAWGLPSAATSVKLAGDADYILTYQGVFSEFANAYQLDKTDVNLGSASPVILAQIYTKKDGAVVLESKISDLTKPAVTADNGTEGATAIEQAQASFNNLPRFVGTDGKEITQGSLAIPHPEEAFLAQIGEKTFGGQDLSVLGYETQEYFLKGTANLYGNNGDELTVLDQNVPYTNRVIVYKPANPADFKGEVFVDILNASDKGDVSSMWRRSYDYIIRNGYAYVGITSKDSSVAALKKYDPQRYNTLSWAYGNGTENGLEWDILGQVGALLKENGGASRLLYGDAAKVNHAYLHGASQSGWAINAYNNFFGKANVQTGTNAHLYDGLLNVVGGTSVTPLSGLNSQQSKWGAQPPKASDVPFILMVGENDFSSGVVRPDSNTATDKYRHYMVAGGAHSVKWSPVDANDAEKSKAGMEEVYLPGYQNDANGDPHLYSNLNMDVHLNVALDTLVKWNQGVEPKASPAVNVDEKGSLVRDPDGNVRSGIVPPQIAVPVATYYGTANGGRFATNGSMVYFSQEKLNQLYPGGKAEYVEKFTKAVDESIAAGWILPEDRQEMVDYAQIEAKVAFDHETWNKSEIERIMNEDVDVKLENGVATVSGPASLYGVVRDDMIYIKKHDMHHTTQATVVVPENFDGTVVIDLVAPDQAPSTVAEDKAAHISLVYDQKWEIPHTGKDYRTTDGFVWDAISQIAHSVKTNHTVWGLPTAATSVKLAGDADHILTYQSVFSKFASYSLEPTNVDLSSAKPVVLAQIFGKDKDGAVVVDKMTDSTVISIDPAAVAAMFVLEEQAEEQPQEEVVEMMDLTIPMMELVPAEKVEENTEEVEENTDAAEPAAPDAEKPEAGEDVTLPEDQNGTPDAEDASKPVEQEGDAQSAETTPESAPENEAEAAPEAGDAAVQQDTAAESSTDTENA